MTAFAEWLAVTLGLKGSFLPGIIGAVVSLRFLPDLKTWRQRLSAALCGGLCANYSAPLVVEAFEVKSGGGEASIAFLIGLFGMSLAAAIIKIIADGEAWSFLKSKFGGGA